MHYSTIISLDIPEIENEDLEINEQIKGTIKDIERKIKNGDDNVMLQIMLEDYKGLTTTFAREVSGKAEYKLERYCENTENPEYLEFVDMTEDLTYEYNNGCISTCFKFPNGLIHNRYSPEFYQKFCFEDGKVYQSNYGPGKSKRRTKKSKRIQVLNDYPINKIYKTFDDYVINYCGYQFYEEHNAYGYYCNPEGKFDWYQIGGRWPELFLVKEGCSDYSYGSRSWCNDDHFVEAPKGYKWVCAARIKDIQWKAMYDRAFEKYKDAYDKLKVWFEEGTVPENDDHYEISEKGISSYCSMVYKSGQSFDDFLRDRGFIVGMKYPLNIYSFLDDNEGWFDCEQVRCADDTHSFEIIKDEEWYKSVEKFISSLDDDTVLVGIDIHN